MAYYVTGDCHGDFRKLIWFAEFNNLGEKDVVILLGDVGLNYFGGKLDKKNKRILAELPNIFLCIHGNHEERPYNIESYQEKRWNGGVVYWEPEFPNILFAKDGEIYNFDGKKAIAIGGAYSVDKYYRLQAGLPWFPDEQPSGEIRQYVEQQLSKSGWHIDFVLSHTCPLCLEPTDLFLDFIDQGAVDKSTEEWLDRIYEKLRYEKWYFGHFHGNREYATTQMLFEEIRELGKDGFVQRLGYPRYKKGEEVLFYVADNGGKYECYGRITRVDELGVPGQRREASYDIAGPDHRNSGEIIDYKHIRESEIEGIDEIKYNEC